MSTTTAPVRPDLVDQLIYLYCEWRAECAEVAAAYERFVSAEPVDRPLAHAAYGAALDREESAADSYASQVALIIAKYAEVNDSTRKKLRTGGFW
jgi:hypothetical protein